MDALMTVILGAILVEALVSAVKPIWDPEKRTLIWAQLVALIIGIGIAFVTNLDLLGAVGVQTTVPFVPQIITGILISRGANYVYDIIAQISASVKKQTSQGE